MTRECRHRFTRPAAVDDPRPYCTGCLSILTARIAGKTVTYRVRRVRLSKETP